MKRKDGLFVGVEMFFALLLIGVYIVMECLKQSKTAKT